MTFTENEHPRAAAGTFADKTQSTPEVSLASEQAEPRKNQKLYVTHPDGTRSMRKSARPYSHALVSTPRDPKIYRAVLKERKAALVPKIAAFESSLAAPSATIRDRGLHIAGAESVDHGFTGQLNYSNFEGFMGQGDSLVWWDCNSKGESQYYFDGEKKVVPIQETLIERSKKSKASLEKDSARLADTIAAIDEGTADLGVYEVVRWSQRKELAVKALSEFDGLRNEGRTITVVAIDE
jgi:hypothetical protein